jgi:predicted DNA-binding transcriptional regulator AlpA
MRRYHPARPADQLNEDHQDLRGILDAPPSPAPRQTRPRPPRPPEPRRLLGIREVVETLSCSRAHLRRLVAQGAFPRPLPPEFGRRPKWRAIDVEGWIASLADREREASA